MRRATAEPLELPKPLAAGALVGVALGVGFITSWSPALGMVAVIGLGLVLWAASHLLVAVAILTASFFFEAYLTGGGFLTPAKGLGAIALCAWLLHWAVRREAIVTTRQMWPVAGLSAWLILSSAASRDLGAAVNTSARWAMFFLLFFLVVQAVDGDRHRAGVLIDVMIASAALAGAIGLWGFFSGTVERAAGPLEDANDFAFLLASTIPLAMWRLGTVQRGRQVLVAAAIALSAAAVLASFSRSGLLGLAAAGVWAVATRRIKARWAGAALLAVVLIGLTAWLFEPSTVEEALTRKQAVAGYNVDTRVSFWETAIEQFRSSPILGVGPGGYEARFAEFNPDYGTFDKPLPVETPTTHNTYLNVLAELGIVGTAFFVAYLVLAWLDLRRRFPTDRSADTLQGALAAGFVVAIVGSAFLTQQFYAPIWVLGALGATLAAGRQGRRAPSARNEALRGRAAGPAPT